MKITETDIPNIEDINIDESKLKLANKIINKIGPLLDEINSDQIEQIDNLNKEIEDNKEKIQINKEKLEQLSKTYSCKKKQKKLLDEILKLNPNILFYNNQIKKEITIILKVIDDLNSDKLDYHLLEITKLNKRSF